jgi:hypothetical protein
VSRRARLALTAAFAALLAVGVLTYADGAKADPYRWCAQYGTSDDNGTNCYFVTLDQCRAAISGNGGPSARRTISTTAPRCRPARALRGAATAAAAPDNHRRRPCVSCPRSLCSLPLRC